MILYFTIASILSFLAGIFLASFIFVPLALVGGIFGFCISLLCLQRSSLMRRRITIVLLSVTGVFFGLGILRYEYAIMLWSSQEPVEVYGERVSLDAVVRATSRSERSQTVYVETQYGYGRVTTDLHPTFSYGDALSIDGILDRPFSDMRTKETFWAQGISFVMYFPHIDRQSRERARGWGDVLFGIRDVFEGSLKAIYPEPYNALADGMLFGSTSGLDMGTSNAFRKSGTSHILVLSGFNISVVATFFLFFASFLFRRRVALAVAMSGVVLFTVMTGAGSPAVRAMCMALIALFGLYAGRQYRAGIALLWALFLMLMWNPLLLRWDASFQLSVAATLGIMYIAPRIDTFLKRTAFPDFFATLIASTIGAQLAVLPFFLWWGVGVSWWSPVANVLVVPLVPLVMALSACASLAGLFLPSLGTFVAFPAFLLMKWQVAVAFFFAS